MGLGGRGDPSSFQASPRDPRRGKGSTSPSSPPTPEGALGGSLGPVLLLAGGPPTGACEGGGMRVGRSVPSGSPRKHDNHERPGAGKPRRGREAGGGAGRVASRPRPRPAPSFLRGAPWPSPSPEGTGVFISHLRGRPASVR